MTNLSTISDEELSRLIAAHLEPMNKLPDIDEENCKTVVDFGIRCWTIESRHKYDQHFEPRNMVTDPAMSMMLLEKTLYEWHDVLLQLHFNQYTIGRTGERVRTDGIRPCHR